MSVCNRLNEEEKRNISPKDVARKGAIAQLGERLICIQEVSGSIPLGSTKTKMISKKR